MSELMGKMSVDKLKYKMNKIILNVVTLHSVFVRTILNAFMNVCMYLSVYTYVHMYVCHLCLCACV